MNKKVSFGIVLGALLVIFGLIGFVFLMDSLDWNFISLSTSQYETFSYEIEEDFDGILMDVDTADISFVPSEDGKCKVECHEDPNDKHRVFVENKMLQIVENTDIKINVTWLNFDKEKITVYLPEVEYSSLSIDASTGNINIPMGFTFGSIDIEVSTGDVSLSASAIGAIDIEADTGDINIDKVSAGNVQLETTSGRITASHLVCGGTLSIDVDTGKAKISNASCNSLISEGDTGDIYLEDVVAPGKIDIKRDTGDVEFSRIDAAEIYINTDTGDIKGSLLSGKNFTAKSNTGKIVIPDDSEGGKCRLTTNTGDIKVTVEK